MVRLADVSFGDAFLIPAEEPLPVAEGHAVRRLESDQRAEDAVVDALGVPSGSVA